MDDDVRLTAAGDAGFGFLARVATRSPEFLASAKSAFNAFHIADAFARYGCASTRMEGWSRVDENEGVLSR